MNAASGVDDSVEEFDAIDRLAFVDVVSIESVADVPPTVGGIQHLVVLDGVRGVAALYVLIHHAFGLSIEGISENSWFGVMCRLLNFAVLGYGHLAVDVFIVLSGYCLMLPVLRSDRLELRGGIGRFIRRRCWRILPPYYSALLVSIVVVLVYSRFEGMGTVADTPGRVPQLGFASVASHVLLIHNIRPEWIFTINPPLWSVAVEWQIYFVFALVLLPMRRWVGTWWIAAAATSVALVPAIFHPFGVTLEWTCPWYVGLFAMGMTAAEVSRTACGDGRELAGSQASRLLCLIACSLLAGLLLAQRSTWSHVRWLHLIRVDYWGTNWPIDVVAGLAAASGLVWLVHGVTAVRQVKLTGIRQVLSSRLVLAVGAISYSLYLIHYPLLFGTRVVLGQSTLRPEMAAVGIFVIGVPISVTSSWLLYKIVEQPTLRARSS